MLILIVVKKKKKYELNGEITFKQSWNIANMYAKESRELYPDISNYGLARLFNKSIYFYHKRLGSKLSKAEASEIIGEKKPCPQYYLDEINTYLSNNDEYKRSSKIVLKDEDEQDERTLTNMELAIRKNKRRGS